MPRGSQQHPKGFLVWKKEVEERTDPKDGSVRKLWHELVGFEAGGR